MHKSLIKSKHALIKNEIKKINEFLEVKTLMLITSVSFIINTYDFIVWTIQRGLTGTEQIKECLVRAVWQALGKMCVKDVGLILYYICAYSHSPSLSYQYGTELLLCLQLIAVLKCSQPDQPALKASETLRLKAGYFLYSPLPFFASYFLLSPLHLCTAVSFSV